MKRRILCSRAISSSQGENFHHPTLAALTTGHKIEDGLAILAPRAPLVDHLAQQAPLADVS